MPDNINSKMILVVQVIMSLVTRSKICKYCCSINSTSLVFDIQYFIGNFKFLWKCGLTLHNGEMKSYCNYFWAEICLFFNNLISLFIGNQNVCIPTVVVLLAIKKSTPPGTTFELKFVCFWITLTWKFQKSKI